MTPLGTNHPVIKPGTLLRWVLPPYSVVCVDDSPAYLPVSKGAHAWVVDNPRTLGDRHKIMHIPGGQLSTWADLWGWEVVEDPDESR